MLSSDMWQEETSKLMAAEMEADHAIELARIDKTLDEQVRLADFSAHSVSMSRSKRQWWR